MSKEVPKYSTIENPMILVQLDSKKHKVKIELENQNIICILLLLEQLQKITQSQHVSSQTILFDGDFNVFSLLIKLATN